jgi:hypothetical protein
MNSSAAISRLLAAAVMLLTLGCVVIMGCAAPFCFAQASGPSQAHRLILKDGSYQAVTKYEIHGDRVRYFSAERGEWEEVPKSLVDWGATEKFEQGRQAMKVAPEAAALDKELEAERKAELARSPQVAPGLNLPDDGGVFLLDTFQNQPQLAELQQTGGELDKNTKSNILRATVNPLGGVKQTIELLGTHAHIQSHTNIPSLYLNIDTNPGGAAPPPTGDPAPLPPLERFKIIRVDVKGGKRVAGALKVAVTGKMKTDERFVPATVTSMTGGWVKLTPTDSLPAGEYAVAEMLGKEGMNLYVWDFGVNPSAPANPSTWKAEPADTRPKSDQPADLQKRDPQ